MRERVATRPVIIRKSEPIEKKRERSNLGETNCMSKSRVEEVETERGGHSPLRGFGKEKRKSSW